jgi:hypothetical protein
MRYFEAQAADIQHNICSYKLPKGATGVATGSEEKGTRPIL